MSSSLVCVECKRTDEGARAWKAVIGKNPDDDHEPAEVLVYCPACWDREFAAYSS
jgi:hypothetical protein